MPMEDNDNKLHKPKPISFFKILAGFTNCRNGGVYFQVPSSNFFFPTKFHCIHFWGGTRMKWECTDVSLWKAALSSYKSGIETLNKPNLISLDEFYTNELPLLLKQRIPRPYITTDELSKLMQWKLTRGKWRPRLLDFVSSLDDDVVKSASQKAFGCLPDVSKAVKELTVLKGVGPATASAILAAYAPDVAPFMSDEAMEAAIGNSKDYTLKSYLIFAEKLQAKAMELTTEEDPFTPSDVERALWSSAVAAKSSAVAAKSKTSSTDPDEFSSDKNTKRKRKR